MADPNAGGQVGRAAGISRGMPAQHADPAPALCTRDQPSEFRAQAFAASQQFASQFAQHYAATQGAPGQSEQLRSFWAAQTQEIENVPTDPAEFKNHQLPLARIKKARMRWAHCKPHHNRPCAPLAHAPPHSCTHRS
jgi:hypothetical protein